MKAKKKYNKGGKVKPVKKKGPKNVIDTLSDEQFLRYIKTKDVNVLPTVSISTLSKESYDKLSEPEKQVYDSFYGDQTQEYRTNVDTGGRTVNTLRKKDDIHWEDALRMVRDSGVKNISNEPSEGAKWKPEKFQIVEDRPDFFRAHADPFGKNIHIPRSRNFEEEGYPEEIYNRSERFLKLPKETQDKINAESERLFRERKNYIDLLSAELAHLNLDDQVNKDDSFWQRNGFAKSSSSKLLDKTYKSRDARRKNEGETPDRSNYYDRDDYEYVTHYSPEGPQYAMFLEYNLTQKLLDLLENQPQ